MTVGEPPNHVLISPSPTKVRGALRAVGFDDPDGLALVELAIADARH